MAISGSCPTCGQIIHSDRPRGHLVCPSCADPIWFARLGSQWVAASTKQLEGRYGFDAGELSEDETIELLCDWREQSAEEPWHIWKAADDFPRPPRDLPPWDNNPYHPPDSAPRKTDSTSETFVFRGRAPCDEESLRWATKSFGLQSDVAGLAFFGFLLAFMLVPVLWSDQIEYLISTAQLGYVAWIVMAVVFWIALRWVPGILMAPYVRVLHRRCKEDPLLADDCFWLTLRQSTLTASAESMVITWPLREVWALHDDAHLVVLRVAPKRLLYLTSHTETTPEDFKLFRKGIKKRLRGRRQFWSFEIN